MEHDRNPIGFGDTVNDLKFLDAVEIVIGIKQLVRRMNFDHADLESQKLIQIGFDIGGVPRVEAAAREQTLRIFLHIISDELVYSSGKADHLGRDVIDEGSAVYPGCVEMFQESFGRPAEFFDLIEIRALPFH